MIDACTIFGFWPKKRIDSSLEGLLKIMETHGVERFLSLSTTGIFYDDEEGNEETLRKSRECPQIIPAATVDLRKYSGVGNRVKELLGKGFRIVRLFPDLQSWPLDYEPFLRVLEQAGKIRMPLMVPVSGLGQATQIGRLAGRFGVTVVLVGVNYGLYAEALAVMRRRGNVYIESAKFNTPDAFEVFVREVGARRIVFASHSPFSYFSSAFLPLERAEIGEEEKSLILKGNIERVLG